MQVCTKCKQEKSLDQFYPRLDTKIGIRRDCVSCHSKKNKTRYTIRRTKTLERRIYKLYGLTSKEHEQMKTKQNNQCLICKRTKPLVVDHCHKTGKVRGLLCSKCNRALGLFEDNYELLQKASSYLFQELNRE